LPTFYSLQVEPKPLKRGLSSQKSIKEDIKPPAEVKKKSTKVVYFTNFRMKADHYH